MTNGAPFKRAVPTAVYVTEPEEEEADAPGLPL